MSTGVATVLLFVPIVLWSVVTQLWLVSICYRKKKQTLARIGLVGLVVPGLFIAPLVGASRLATPSSNWAVLHYGDEFMGRAARRFPNDHDVAIRFSLPKHSRTTWEKLIVGGLAVTAMSLVVLFGRADFTGYVSIALLGQLAAIASLAEVELSALAYSGRSATSPTPDPAPIPAIH